MWKSHGIARGIKRSQTRRVGIAEQKSHVAEIAACKWTPNLVPMSLFLTTYVINDETERSCFCRTNIF